jgi:hypothetical protein
MELCEVGTKMIRTAARSSPEAYRPGSVEQDDAKGRTNPLRWGLVVLCPSHPTLTIEQVIQNGAQILKSNRRRKWK